jgi:PAS domain S-box-containing protein
MFEPGLEDKDPSRRLAEINRAITTSLNFDEVLDLIVENSAQLMSATACLLLLMDRGELLRIRAAQGVKPSLVKKFAGRMSEDVLQELRASLKIREQDNMVSVPVIDKQELNGLLVVVREQPMSAEERWQLSAFADQAAIALRNARLYEMALAEALRGREAYEIEARRLAAIVEGSDDAIVSKDLSGVIRSWNKGATRVFGYEADEVIGKPITIVIPPDRQAEETLILTRIRRGERIEHFETVRRRKDGRLIDISLTISPVKNDRGEIVGCSKIARDITDAKRAEEQLRRALQFDETVMLSMGEGLFTVDSEGLLTFMNPAAQKMFGWTLEELIGRRMHDVTHHTRPDGSAFPREECVAYKVLKDGLIVNETEDVFIRKDGTFFNVVYSSSPLRADEKITGLVVVFRDITERRQAEEEIRFQARLLDAVEQAVIATDLNGTIIFWNSFAEHLYGWSAAEALGANILDVTPSPVLRDRANEILARLQQGQSWAGEFRVQRRDGSLFPAMVTDSPIFNNKGELIGIVGVSVDNTLRRKNEEEREKLLAGEREARAEAENANRLKDEFLATLSHELRNPLNVVIGYAEILRRSDESQKHSFVVKAAETIRRNALAQAQLVSDLLDLSRLQMGKLSLNRQPLSLSTVISDAIETVRGEATARNISLEVDLDSEVVVVEGDPIRLGQIAWNLLNNAIKFTPPGGRVKIGLREQENDAMLVVEDSGQGISPDFLPHVFEIFRQADATFGRKQGGMGIGLALVKQLAELHGGGVEAESDGDGHGARFTVRIPLYTPGVSALPSEKTGTTGALKRKFILVVDDSPETTEMLGKLLELEGAFVESARSGAEAIEIAGRKDFDLIISDISMPGMDGYQLIRNLRQLPDMANVPAVALTGYGRPNDIERAHAEGFAEHLTKPLDLDQLLKIVRKLTGEPVSTS